MVRNLPETSQPYQMSLYPLQQKCPSQNLIYIYFQHQIILSCMQSSGDPPRQTLVIIQEAPPAEPEVPPTLTLKTLFTPSPRQHFHADFKMHPIHPTAPRQLRKLPGRQNATPSHSTQQPAPGRICHKCPKKPNSQHL